MTDSTSVVALLLGILEGMTEFIPVSSTGHLLLAGHFLGFQSAGRTFEVVIQLGAIVALLLVYGRRIVATFAAAPHDPAARRFIAAVLIAFLPAAVFGALAHDVIKTLLFETPTLIAAMLVIGGIIILWVDRLDLPVRYTQPDAIPPRTALGIGLFQCLALVPGVSRSGATIVGAMLLGTDKRAAAEFSFFLSMPTMIGAVTFDLYKNRGVLDAGAWGEIAIGFLAAFVSAMIVVRWLLGFVSRRGYALFGWWRIIVGTVALVALWGL